MADRLRPLLRWEAGLVLLLIGTIIYGNNASQYFFTSGNVFFILLNVGEVAIMALPLTLIVITGEIDLSVASILGLSGITMGEIYTHGYGLWWAMAGALVVGALAGAFNGLLITRLGLPSLAVTIGTLTLYRVSPRASCRRTRSRSRSRRTRTSASCRFAAPRSRGRSLFFAVLAVIFGSCCTRRRSAAGSTPSARGRRRRASPASACERIKFWLYVLSGLSERLRRDPLHAAVLVCALRLGDRTRALRGDDRAARRRLHLRRARPIIGVVLAVLVLGSLQTAMTQALVSSQEQNIVIGALLILSVVVPNLPGIYRRARLRLRSMAARRHASEAAEAAEA